MYAPRTRRYICRNLLIIANPSSEQRLGMMMLLGQHGQPQDYQMGLEYIHYAAESCDENAPQGAYVRNLGILSFRVLN